MRIKSFLMIIYTAIVVVMVFSITITAMQEEFNQSASLKFLFWETQRFSMLLYVAAAFVIGLLVGLFVAVIDNFHNRKAIKNLKKQLEAAQQQIAQQTIVQEETAQEPAQSAQDKI